MSELGKLVRTPPPAPPEPAQLTLEGVEVPVVARRVERRPLSHVQRAILTHLREHGQITSTEAGELVHRWGPSTVPHERRREYRSSDGWSALDRLRKHGLVVNDREARVWRATGA